MVKVKVFMPQGLRQTGQKQDAPKFHSRGLKIVQDIFAKKRMPQRQQSSKWLFSVSRSLTLVSLEWILLVEYACQI